jgi:hypothetical protein
MLQGRPVEVFCLWVIARLGIFVAASGTAGSGKVIAPISLVEVKSSRGLASWI